MATTLFKEAKTLLDAGKVPEACRKLEESQRIYPAGGTLLNLAVCHEREGKTASAWAEFREARVIAERDGRDDRIALAESHRSALEPKLSKLVVQVDALIDVPSIEVKVDAHPWNRAAWGLAIPVDPGTHVIEATALGRKPARQLVRVLPDADTQTVSLPAWEDEVKPPPPPPIEIHPRPTPIVLAVPPARDRTAAVTAFSLGAGSLAMGTYFGILAIARHAQSNHECTANPCGRKSDALNAEAASAADAATVTIVVGLVGLALGAGLWIFAGRSLPARVGAGAVSWTF